MIFARDTWFTGIHSTVDNNVLVHYTNNTPIAWICFLPEWIDR